MSCVGLITPVNLWGPRHPEGGQRNLGNSCGHCTVDPEAFTACDFHDCMGRKKKVSPRPKSRDANVDSV